MTLTVLSSLVQGAWAQTQTSIPDLTFHEGYYEIPDVAALQALAKYVNEGNETKNLTFKMTADITFSESDGFTPIGMGDELEGTPFRGTFDGEGHTILGIKYDNSEGVGFGLFGHIAFPAVIKNLKLDEYEGDGKCRPDFLLI